MYVIGNATSYMLLINDHSLTRICRIYAYQMNQNQREIKVAIILSDHYDKLNDIPLLFTFAGSS